MTGSSSGNVPQAWAAGSVLRFIAILAGIHATTDSKGSRIYVNPALPDWLPSLTIRNLRAGGGSLDLNDGQIEIPPNTTRFEVIHGPAPHPVGRTVRARADGSSISGPFSDRRTRRVCRSPARLAAARSPGAGKPQLAGKST
jgi:hypothetical protein